MPSVSTKSSQQQAPQVSLDLMQDPVKSAITVLDKKLRNLEKRKMKLLETKKKAEEGNEISQEQKEALERISLVDNSLETVKELQKNMVSLDQEYVKLIKKEQKRMKQEKKDQCENNLFDYAHKVVEVLGLLGDLVEDVRQDFLNGSNGACLLTEDELNNLDKIYAFVNPPTAGEEKLSVRIKNAAGHLAQLVQGTDEPVFEGVTYKSLLTLLYKIRDSGYFDKDSVREFVKDAKSKLEEVPSIQEETPVTPVDSPTQECTPQEYITETIETTLSTKPVYGVDLPPEVEESSEYYQIDFMGESEIHQAVPAETSPPPLNPVSPEFVPRNLQKPVDETTAWEDMGTSQNNHDGWNDSSNPNEAGWHSVDSNHQSNQQSGGFRGRGGRGRGFGGRGRGRGGGGGSGGNGFRGGRDGANFRGGNRGARGGNRGQRGGPRGGNRSGERGGHRDGFGKPSQQQ